MTDQEQSPDFDEIKRYVQLRRNYYESSKLTTEFDVNAFHELSEKYDPIDILSIYMNNRARLLAELEQIKKERDSFAERLEFEKAGHIHCCKCGKIVSTSVPANTIVRAFVECPECIESKPKDDCDQLDQERAICDLFRQVLRSIQSNINRNIIAGENVTIEVLLYKQHVEHALEREKQMREGKGE